MSEPLWTPSERRIKSARLTQFQKHIPNQYNLSLDNYTDLHNWSVEHTSEFWSEIWRASNVVHSQSYNSVIENPVMPGAKWLPWLYEDGEAGVHETALELANYLRKRTSKVSSRAAKADLSSKLSTKSWQRARVLALEMVPWTMEGQSMTPMFRTWTMP